MNLNKSLALETMNEYGKNKIPFLGLCLGMQCAVVDFARNVCGLKDANSTEFKPKTKNPVISLLIEQKDVKDLGGTMRLGAYPCRIKTNTLAAKVYKANLISERHRHRFEFNNDYLKAFEKSGMSAVGINPESNLVEIIEIPALKWFVGTQFHPEYQSTVLRPNQLFVDFIKASLEYSKTK